MGSKMESKINTMFNYIVKQKGDYVVSLEIDRYNLASNIVKQFLYKHNIFKEIIVKEEFNKKARYNSIVLMPYFTFEAEIWSKNIGVDMKYWSEQEHNKFKHYFMNKYRGMMK